MDNKKREMEDLVGFNKFYKGKKVFVTGHTGFKGGWLTRTLLELDAIVIGFSIDDNGSELLNNISKKANYKSLKGDIRDYECLFDAIKDNTPEIIFHLAAQPLVRESYKDPKYTYEVNTLGTLNLLECCRKTTSVRSVVNVTTDKVYKNNEWVWAYREHELLDGFDPYSNSKSCSELITSTYIRSFQKNFYNVGISTCRAGNVIGGGDFSSDRIVPDCYRSAINNEPLVIRNPYSIRPYQHVLEPISAYILIAASQYGELKKSGNYNIGPDDKDCVSTEELVKLFKSYWTKTDLEVIVKNNFSGPHEAGLLKLDSSKIKSTLRWSPSWGVAEAVAKTIDWYELFLNGGNVELLMKNQIHDYFKKKIK